MSDPAKASARGGWPTKWRVLSYVGAWVATLFALDARLLPLAYMFPMGLYAAVVRPDSGNGPDTGWPLIIGGWLLYLVHAVIFFRARTSRSFWVAAGVLVLLLVVNIGGCQVMLKGTGYGW